MTQPDVYIRRGAEEDLETIVRFNLALAAESEHKSLDAATVRAGVLRALREPAICPYYLAECHNRVIGQAAVTLEWSDWRNGFYWWLQSVYVTPAFRGRGVFRALYQHIGGEARRRGDVRGLRLYVHRDNVPAIETYRRLGMTLADYLICEDDRGVFDPPAPEPATDRADRRG